MSDPAKKLLEETELLLERIIMLRRDEPLDDETDSQAQNTLDKIRMYLYSGGVS